MRAGIRLCAHNLVRAFQPKTDIRHFQGPSLSSEESRSLTLELEILPSFRSSQSPSPTAEFSGRQTSCIRHGPRPLYQSGHLLPRFKPVEGDSQRPAMWPARGFRLSRATRAGAQSRHWQLHHRVVRFLEVVGTRRALSGEPTEAHSGMNGLERGFALGFSPGHPN